MALPMRHLLAGSAVAGLLFLLPVGAPANAQDNRNTGGWGAAGGVLTFVAAAVAAGGSITVLASKGKKLDQLDSGVKALNEKLTKLETINLERRDMNIVSTSLGTIKSDFIELNENVKKMDTKLKEYMNNSANDLTSALENKIDNLGNSLKKINQHINSEHEKVLNDRNQEVQKVSESLRQCKEEKERSLKIQESNEKRRWEIMKNLCKNHKNNKIHPINYLKLIKVTTSVDCLDCLDAAGKLLPDSLEILPDASKSAEDFKKDFNPDKIGQLFEFLWKLGTSFRDEMLKMKKSGKKSSPQEVARSVFSGQYAHVMGSDKKGQSKKEFHIPYQKDSVDMSQHLKIDGKNTHEPPGTRKTKGKSDNSCLRIHFAWHDKSNKVLIGHCGRHR